MQMSCIAIHTKLKFLLKGGMSKLPIVSKNIDIDIINVGRNSLFIFNPAHSFSISSKSIMQIQKYQDRQEMLPVI